MSTNLIKTKYRPTKGFISTVLQEITGKSSYDLVILSSALVMNLHKMHKGKKSNYFVDAITYLESGEVNIEDAELLLTELIAERLLLKTGKVLSSEQDEFVDELLNMFIKDSEIQHAQNSQSIQSHQDTEKDNMTAESQQEDLPHEEYSISSDDDI